MTIRQGVGLALRSGASLHAWGKVVGNCCSGCHDRLWRRGEDVCAATVNVAGHQLAGLHHDSKVVRKEAGRSGDSRGGERVRDLACGARPLCQGFGDSLSNRVPIRG